MKMIFIKKINYQQYIFTWEVFSFKLCFWVNHLKYYDTPTTCKINCLVIDYLRKNSCFFLVRFLFANFKPYHATNHTQNRCEPFKKNPTEIPKLNAIIWKRKLRRNKESELITEPTPKPNGNGFFNV